MNIILHVKHVDPTSVPVDWALVTVPLQGGLSYYAAPLDAVIRTMREMAADDTRTLELVVREN
jgi:hypothetical protein